MRLIALLVVVCWAAAAAEDGPAPVPSMYPAAWTWAALYGQADGTGVILALSATAGARIDLGGGRRPVPTAVSVDPEGRLSDGIRIEDHARRIAQPDLALVARWVRAIRTDGFDTLSATVPIPERVGDPLRAVLLDHQAQLLAQAIAGMEPSDDSGRAAPAEEAMPPYTWRYSDDTLTEVTWWSADLVSTIDWRVAYSGGVHANTYLLGHTWRRDGAGMWRLITLDDLLGPSTTWKPIVLRAIVDELVRQEAGWFVDAAPSLRPTDDRLLRVWSVAGDGLVMSFQPYEVGPYSQGVFQVRIPWTTLGRERP